MGRVRQVSDELDDQWNHGFCCLIEGSPKPSESFCPHRFWIWVLQFPGYLYGRGNGCYYFSCYPTTLAVTLPPRASLWFQEPEVTSHSIITRPPPPRSVTTSSLGFSVLMCHVQDKGWHWVRRCLVPLDFLNFSPRMVWGTALLKEIRYGRGNARFWCLFLNIS